MGLGITTRDILSVMIVGAALVFNGISLVSGKPVDAATIGMAGIVVGWYFKGSVNEATAATADEELPPPSLGGGEG